MCMTITRCRARGSSLRLVWLSHIDTVILIVAWVSTFTSSDHRWGNTCSTLIRGFRRYAILHCSSVVSIGLHYIVSSKFRESSLDPASEGSGVHHITTTSLSVPTFPSSRPSCPCIVWDTSLACAIYRKPPSRAGKPNLASSCYPYS